MRHALCALLLTAPLVLISTPAAEAQMARQRPRRQPVLMTGVYLSGASQAYCYVLRRPDGYLFIDENGGQALFDFTAPDRLEILAMTEGDPRIVATVGRDELDRPAIRFDAPGMVPAFWVLAR